MPIHTQWARDKAPHCETLTMRWCAAMSGLHNEWVWSNDEMILWDKPKKPGGKPVPVPFHPPQVSHDVTWDWTQGSEMRSKHLKDPLTHKVLGYYIKWCVTPASAVYTVAMFIFFTARNLNYKILADFQWHNSHATFFKIQHLTQKLQYRRQKNR